MGDAQNCAEKRLRSLFHWDFSPEFQPRWAPYCGNEAAHVPASPPRLAHLPQRRGPEVPALHAPRRLPGEIHPDRLQGGLGLVAISNIGGVPLLTGSWSVDTGRLRAGRPIRQGSGEVVTTRLQCCFHHRGSCFLSIVGARPAGHARRNSTYSERDMNGRRGAPHMLELERSPPASVPLVSEAGHGTSARWHSGCRAPSADERTATPSEPGDERGRRSRYQLRCGSSSWTLSTRGSHSGPCSVTSA
jgi:hypothetical protein